ncbi:MAG TPA: DUF3376 domain-containing protein, partial [Pyrinomonadaceae bacterium]|nr:DUF3376 domain-containing protein [Pyrinomonadaceae bacterium]
DRVMNGLLRDKGRAALRDKVENENERRAASHLIVNFDRWLADPAIRDAFMDEIFRHFDVYYRLRRLFRTVYFILKQIEKLESSDSNDPEVAAKITRYRTLWKAVNKQIELFDIIRSAMERLVDKAPLLWAGRSALEIWEDAKSAFYRLLDADATTPPTALLQGCYDRNITTCRVKPVEEKKWLTSKNLSEYHAALKARADSIIAYIDANGGTLPRVPRTNTVIEAIDERELEILSTLLPDENDLVRKAYKEFWHLDAKLFPMELIADLHEKDIVETIRISPRDAEKGFSKKSLADKVSGDTLYHFGGFFKRSWRSNDILWGRLDGLCQLIESLLTKERLAHVVNHSGLRRKIRSNLTDGFYYPFDGDAGEQRKIAWKGGMSPAQLFPRAGRQSQERLERWLSDLFSENKNHRDAALEQFPAMLELIIEAAQLEVIDEEVPKVIADALEEQGRWNQFRIPLEQNPAARQGWRKVAANVSDYLARLANFGEDGATAADAFSFSPAKGDLDPFFAVVAAAGQTEKWMETYRKPEPVVRKPADTKLGKFFREEYNIGSETLTKDMPTIVLLEILSVSLLVLRNCVLDIFGERAAGIKRHPLYVALVEIPLRSFNGIIMFWRRAPRTRKSIVTGLIVLSILTLVVGITWRDGIIFEPSGHKLILKWFVVFIIAPSVV